MLLNFEWTRMGHMSRMLGNSFARMGRRIFWKESRYRSAPHERVAAGSTAASTRPARDGDDVVIATLMTLGCKKPEAVRLAGLAVGSSVEERISDALRKR